MAQRGRGRGPYSAHRVGGEGTKWGARRGAMPIGDAGIGVTVGGGGVRAPTPNPSQVLQEYMVSCSHCGEKWGHRGAIGAL